MLLVCNLEACTNPNPPRFPYPGAHSSRWADTAPSDSFSMVHIFSPGRQPANSQQAMYALEVGLGVHHWWSCLCSAFWVHEEDMLTKARVCKHKSC
mmetsp:Transcript_76228/g.134534  ORF Transcript_76228/g.134534 Transcript_76228/m.134534 type:complete len:96 (+) Transcript_76228:289-576(+)